MRYRFTRATGRWWASPPQSSLYGNEWTRELREQVFRDIAWLMEEYAESELLAPDDGDRDDPLPPNLIL